MQHRLDGSELTIDTCIVCVFPDMAVNLKGEVECRCLLWKIDGLSFGSEHNDVIIVERCHDILDEATFLLVKFHILQDIAETVYPSAYITLLTFSDNPDDIVANHTLRRDMYLFPAAIVRQQLHMEALVAILLGRIDIVQYSARLLPENRGQARVHLQHHVLLLLHIFTREDDFYEVAVWQVVEVHTCPAHLAPQTVWLPILCRYVGMDAVLLQYLIDL